jgi:ubiquinone/menaquinone biosynthesis C-methylase UbiE
MPGSPAAPFYSRWRGRLVQNLRGNILEIGVGKGENLGYYRRADRVFAIEPDPQRALHAYHAGQRATVDVQIYVAPAETLPYADNQFDHIVCSLVFCSVRDQRLALREIGRVLKAGGSLQMVEHVRPQNSLLAHLFSALTPWWRRIAFNCHLDRPTVDVLREEGWSVTVRKQRALFVRLSAIAPDPNL